MTQHYQQGCVDVVQLDERLTGDELPAIDPVLSATLTGRLPQLVIDLRRLRLIDSTGLEMLYQLHVQALRRGGAVHLAAPSPLIRDVMRITGMDQELAVHRDVVAAAGAFAL
jgi:anti-anti-sigma factor